MNLLLLICAGLYWLYARNRGIKVLRISGSLALNFSIEMGFFIE